MKTKKFIIVTLLLLIPVLMVGCNKAAEGVEEATPVPVITEFAELTEEQYLTFMTDSLGKITDGFQQMTTLLDESNKDVKWEDKMNIELEKIQATSLEYLGLQKVPEKYSKVHEHITDYMTYNILVVESYPVKSADQSVESVAITTGYMREWTASIGKALKELDKIN